MGLRHRPPIEQFDPTLVKEKSSNLTFKEEEVSWLDNLIPDFTSISDKKTQVVSDFYNDIKFPNYDGMETFGDLLNKGQREILTRSLDEQIPYNTSILELGCGTGQMSLYLSRFNRVVTGADISIGSLVEAEKFW